MDHPYPLHRRTELSYPAHVGNARACRPVEPLVGGPQFAADTLRQRQIVRVVGRVLLELACKLKGSDMKIGRLMEFETRRKQPRDHPNTVADVQFATQHAPVKSVGDLEGHEIRGDAGDVLGNPGLEGGVGVVRVVLLNEPLDRQACIDHHGPVSRPPRGFGIPDLTGLPDQVGGTPWERLAPEYLLPQLCKQLMVRLVGQ